MQLIWQTFVTASKTVGAAFGRQRGDCWPTRITEQRALHHRSCGSNTTQPTVYYQNRVGRLQYGILVNRLARLLPKAPRNHAQFSSPTCNFWWTTATVGGLHIVRYASWMLSNWSTLKPLYIFRPMATTLVQLDAYTARWRLIGSFPNDECTRYLSYLHCQHFRWVSSDYVSSDYACALYRPTSCFWWAAAVAVKKQTERRFKRDLVGVPKFFILHEELIDLYPYKINIIDYKHNFSLFLLWF